MAEVSTLVMHDAIFIKSHHGDGWASTRTAAQSQTTKGKQVGRVKISVDLYPKLGRYRSKVAPGISHVRIMWHMNERG